MDITIFQFLVGVMAGTASGLVLVLVRGGKNQPGKITLGSRRPVPPAVRSRIIVTPPRTRTMRPRSLAKPRTKGRALPAVVVADVQVSPTSPALNISACPACGLEAPEALMSEHFLGSPQHRHGTPQPKPMIWTEMVDEESASSVEVDEDPRGSMRNLLQMLVPPRAFGHRHQQKTVNPISRLVRTLETSQSALVQPLKGSI